MEQSKYISEAVFCSQLPAFYGARRCIVVFTRALNSTLCWASCMLSTKSHGISLRSILILSSHLRLDLPSISSLQALRQRGYIHFHLFNTCYMLQTSWYPWVSHHDCVKSTNCEAPRYATFCSLLQFLHLRGHPVLKHTQSLLFLPTCQVWHSGKIVVLYLCLKLCVFRCTKNTEDSELNDNKNPSNLTNWSWGLLEEQQVDQLVKNFPTFVGTECSLPCSQEPAAGPYSKSDQSSPYHPIRSL
jgi:hypothetical protein